MTRHLVLILGDQLNLDNPALDDFDADNDQILMVECSGEASHVWSHKARIVMFLSAMRHHEISLKEYASVNANNFIYLKLGEHDFVQLKDAWAHYISVLNPQKVVVCEPGEYRLEQELITLCSQTNTQLVIRDDTHFMCSRADFKHWANKGKQLRMEFFYRVMRKKYDVLMQAGEPEGGAWNYDAENRKTFGKAGPQNVPIAPEINIDNVTQQVIEHVEQNFPAHPGSLKHFIWPVNRSQALNFLAFFMENKLAGFGDHQDAMWSNENVKLSNEHVEPTTRSPYLWHSLLSTSLNLKLLSPREVIKAAVESYRKKQLPLASVEGFIRQILGWREFIRGVYWLDMPEMGQSNHYNHTRQLPNWYWTGDTKMNCMKQTVNDTLNYGYAHHIQRLMVTGMFGVLAELNPREVEAWYLAVYVDAVEWVELPNVTGMALYANGGRFTSKPYIASGAYINRMSNYCKGCRYDPTLKTGESACPFTTLYWHFLIKHYDTFSRNPRTALMTKNVDRFNNGDVASINIHANKMLANLNSI